MFYIHTYFLRIIYHVLHFDLHLYEVCQCPPFPGLGFLQWPSTKLIQASNGIQHLNSVLLRSLFLARPMLSPSSICDSKIFDVRAVLGYGLLALVLRFTRYWYSACIRLHYHLCDPLLCLAGPQNFWDHANRTSIHLGNCVPHAQTVLMGNRVDAFLLFRRLRRVSQILSASAADDKQQKQLGKGWSSHHGVWSSSRVGMIRPWSQLSTSFNHFQVNPCRCLKMFFQQCHNCHDFHVFLSVHFDFTSQGSSSGVPGLHGLILQGMVEPRESDFITVWGTQLFPRDHWS